MVVERPRFLVRGMGLAGLAHVGGKDQSGFLIAALGEENLTQCVTRLQAQPCMLAIVADGNSDGRKVSGGTYLAIINIYDSGKSINIGDARKQRIVIMH